MPKCGSIDQENRENWNPAGRDQEIGAQFGNIISEMKAVLEVAKHSYFLQAQERLWKVI